MYSPRKFEEAAFDLYIQGMLDYMSVCEEVLIRKYDDPGDFQWVLDKAQEIFEERCS